MSTSGPSHQSKTRLPQEYVTKLRRMVDTIGFAKTSETLRCNTATLDKILGPNTLMPHTAARLMRELENVK